MAEAVAGLNRAKRAGLTRHIGISNFTVRQVEEAVALSDEPLVIDADGDALEGLPEANLGTFEGGNTGHTEDASESNVLQPEDQRADEDARFNVPSNGPPSPLYDADAFSQKILRFEEFGLSFQNALRMGFLDLAALLPERCRVIDGNRAPEVVAAIIQS